MPELFIQSVMREMTQTDPVPPEENDDLKKEKLHVVGTLPENLQALFTVMNNYIKRAKAELEKAKRSSRNGSGKELSASQLRILAQKTLVFEFFWGEAQLAFPELIGAGHHLYVSPNWEVGWYRAHRPEISIVLIGTPVEAN